MTNILTRAAVHEQLGSLLSINDPEVFVQRYVDAVREISVNGKYNSRPGAVLESLSEDVLYTLSQEGVSVIQFYAAAKALYSANGIFASQQFGAGAIGTSESQYVVALCLDATGIKVSDRLLRMAKQFFVIHALRGRDVWTEFNADMTAIQEAFKVGSLTCYVSELLGDAHDYLIPSDAKEFPETGCKDFLESRGMAPFGVLYKFMLGIETSNQSMTVFRRLDELPAPESKIADGVSTFR